MNHKAKNYFGWYGVLAILLAYFLISLDIISDKSVIYQLLNLSGALGIVIVALSKKDKRPAALNIAWAIIAAIALIRILI